MPQDSYQSIAAVLLPIEDHRVGAERVPTVNAGLLHVWLGNSQEFSNWIEARIVQFGFVRNTDFTLHEITETDGRVLGDKPGRVDYYLTLDMAKELALFECKEKGRQARQYFIAWEKRLKANPAGGRSVQALSDPRQLRTLLLGFTERLLAVEAEAAADTRKLALQEAIGETANAQCIQSVAKVLGIGSVKFFEWLRRAGILMQNNLPYQCHIAADYFKVVQRSFIGKNDQKQLYARTFVTGKGLSYLQKRYQAALQTGPRLAEHGG